MGTDLAILLDAAARKVIAKLLISMAAMVARRRLSRGVKLNHPEAIALVAEHVVEGARDGRSVADLMEAAGYVVTRAQVMEGHGR